MSTPNRGALIKKTYRILKQHYKPVLPDSGRPLMEQLLFAVCLENAPYGPAEKVYSALRASFFDWNEVRVSTVMELAEVTSPLPDPATAAGNLKRTLQAVFESTYSFDLEPLKKQNIGAGIKRMEKLEGTTPFSVAYATQTALGGHFIPLDSAALATLYVLGIATEKEVHAKAVAGLERTIPKNKGIEFGSLLHQLAADFYANTNSPTVRKLLLSIAPDAKDRFPKRGAKILAAVEKDSAKPGERPTTVPPGGKKLVPPGRKPPDKKIEEKKFEKKGPEKKMAERKGAEKKRVAPRVERKPLPAKKKPSKQLSKQKPR